MRSQRRERLIEPLDVQVNIGIDTKELVDLVQYVSVLGCCKNSNIRSGSLFQRQNDRRHFNGPTITSPTITGQTITGSGVICKQTIHLR